jgi:hypothetical protein
MRISPCKNRVCPDRVPDWGRKLTLFGGNRRILNGDRVPSLCALVYVRWFMCDRPVKKLKGYLVLTTVACPLAASPKIAKPFGARGFRSANRYQTGAGFAETTNDDRS